MPENEWKKRTHTVPMNVDGQPIENAIGSLYAQVDRIEDRLSKLEKGPGTPVTRRVFDAGPPLPEFFIPVDRGAGTIGEDETRHALEGAAPRAMGRRDLQDGSEEVLPEYFVPVDRSTGIIGGDE